MESSRITNIQPSMYYIPNFITEEEESNVLSKIPPTRWISLSHRRLQTIPAKLTSTNTLISSSPLPSWLTDPIVSRIHSLSTTNGEKLFFNAPHGINHCLINEYLPGQGIMPHEDGAAYHPVVATVSLSGTLVLDVTEKPGASVEGESGSEGEKGERKSWRIVQEPRSLLITTGEAYTETLHGIAEVTEDVGLDAKTVANWELLSEQGRKLIERNGGRNERTTRISLTYRDVKKVSTIGSKVFGKART